MKKRIPMILALVLACMMLFSVLPGVSAVRRSYNGAEKIYVNLDAIEWWQDDGAVTRLYLFDNDGGSD